MTDFGYLKDVAPETITDVSFDPVNGAYECRIDALEHLMGDSKKTGEPYDFYSLNVQVTKVVEGDGAMNRYLKKIFSNDEKGITDLRNSMHTAGVEGLDFSNSDQLDATMNMAKDKIIKVRAWNPKRMKKDGEQWIEHPDGGRTQKIKVVAEFQLKNLKTAANANSSSAEAKIPF